MDRAACICGPTDGGGTAPVSPDNHRLRRPDRPKRPDGCSGNNAFRLVLMNQSNVPVHALYADLSSAGASGNDQGDIYIQEGIVNPDLSLNWSGATQDVKVNRDNTQTDQWDPAVAVNPAGTELFVGCYSRQDDPGNNSLIRAYGAKANLTHLGGGDFDITNATFDAVAISPTTFAPLFPGGTSTTPSSNPCLFDHVWLQEGVCLDDYADVVDGCDPVWWQVHGHLVSSSTYQHFMADDYTWAASDGTYFYYAWRDTSQPFSCGGNANARSDADVLLGRIKP